MNPRSIRRTLLVVVSPLAAAGGLEPPQAAGPDETAVWAESVLPELSDILDTARERAPALLRRSAELDVAEAGVDAARARRWPTIHATLQTFAQHEERVDIEKRLDTNKVYYRFQVTQPLYHFGALQVGEEVSRLHAGAAAAARSEAERELLLEVRRRFLDIVVRRAELDAESYAAETRRLRLEQAERRFEALELSLGEIQDVRLRNEEAEVNLERLHAEFEAAVGELERLAGLVVDPKALPSAIPALKVSDSPPPVRASGRELRLAPLCAAADVEEQTAFLARARLYPKINAVAGYYADELAYSLNVGERVGTHAAFVGLSVDWTIFDGREARALERQALARRRAHDLARLQAEAALDAEVRRLEAEEARTRRLLAVALQRLAGAEASLTVVRENVERGTQPELAVRDVEYARRGFAVAVYRLRAQLLDVRGQRASLTAGDPRLAAAP